MYEVAPPNITYRTKDVFIQVSLPCNMDYKGNPLDHPLPTESEIREIIIKTANKLQEKLEGNECQM